MTNVHLRYELKISISSEIWNLRLTHNSFVHGNSIFLVHSRDCEKAHLCILDLLVCSVPFNYLYEVFVYSCLGMYGRNMYQSKCEAKIYCQSSCSPSSMEEKCCGDSDLEERDWIAPKEKIKWLNGTNWRRFKGYLKIIDNTKALWHKEEGSQFLPSLF